MNAPDTPSSLHESSFPPPFGRIPRRGFRLILLFACSLLLFACQQSPSPSTPKPLDIPGLSALQARHPGLFESLVEQGIQVQHIKIDSNGYAPNVIQVSLPDSARLRSWEGLTGLFAKIGKAAGWSGKFDLLDEEKSVMVSLDFGSNDLDLMDPSGFFQTPSVGDFKRGIDRIKRTPRKIGIREEREDDDQTPMTRCDGLQDVNGRLYYVISFVSYMVADRESGVGMTQTNGPVLVDAVTGENWAPGSGSIWKWGNKETTRFLPDFADTNSRHWRLVARECSEEGGMIWQYQASTRTLEKIDLDPIKKLASHRLNPKLAGEIVSLVEWGDQEDSSYQMISLLRNGGDYTLLRSNGAQMFAQRWVPPASEGSNRYLLDIYRNRFSYDSKEYSVDEIEWTDVEDSVSSEQNPSQTEDPPSP